MNPPPHTPDPHADDGADLPPTVADRLFFPLLPTDPREVGGYTLRARIGQGGMGAVYLSTSRGGRPIALKVVRQDFADDPHFRRRFATEVAIARRVQGAYTVPVIDADTEADQPWIATSYVPAPNLAVAVGRAGPLPARAVLGVLAGVAEALEAIHRVGVVHRDLKPANVILAAEGPLVIDFGLARATKAQAITHPGVPVGTPAYMAPEQVAHGTVDAASDIFALGSTAFFAATGDAPFGTDIAVFHRITNTDPDWDLLAWPLNLVLGRCLDKTPERRASCEELIDLCHRLAGDLEPGDDTVVLSSSASLLGEGWLPAPINAEIARYRQAAAALPSAPARVTGSMSRVQEGPSTEIQLTDPFGPGATAPPRVTAPAQAPRHRLAQPRVVVPLGAAGVALVLTAGLVAAHGDHGKEPVETAPTAPVTFQAPEEPLETPSQPAWSPSSPPPSSASASSAAPTTAAGTPTAAPTATAAPSASPTPMTLGDLLRPLLPPLLNPPPPSTTPPAGH